MVGSRLLSSRGAFHDRRHLEFDQKTAAPREAFAANDIRTLIANHLGVDVKLVTDEAHFTDDLGADWLDRLELMIVIEDEFAGVEMTDDDVQQTEIVGDLSATLRAWIARGDDEAPLQ